MDAKELRIGNNVADVSGVILTVTGVKGGIVWATDGINDIQYGIGELRNINLTEEWLVEFGYDNKSGGQYYKNWRQQHGGDTGTSVVLFNNGKCYYIIALSQAKSIDYLHQLQNLYFALTGEELTLKTPN